MPWPVGVSGCSPREEKDNDWENVRWLAIFGHNKMCICSLKRMAVGAFRFGLGACCGGRMDGRRGGALLPSKTPLSFSVSLYLQTDEITPTRETHFGRRASLRPSRWNHEIISKSAHDPVVVGCWMACCDQQRQFVGRLGDPNREDRNKAPHGLMGNLGESSFILLPTHVKHNAG